MTRLLITTLCLGFLFACAPAPGTMKGTSATAPVVEKADQKVAVKAAPVADTEKKKAAQQAVVAKPQQEFYKSSKPFLTEYSQQEGVKRLAGGVMARVLRAGSGAKPTIEDTVEINFHATRTDGSLVATTKVDGVSTPRIYPLRKVSVELRRALLEMSQGAKWEVVVPPSNRNILTEKKGALIYEVELLAINPAGAKGN